ncbi:MAG: redoxin domain-containing protein [Candidatus Aminicenantes bacterium]|nr:redoxin domain-containing protein [Candidatus Aminicenantes bacterium]
MKKRFSKAFLFIFLITFLGIIPAKAQRAIDFALNDLDGNLIKLSDYYHKNVILIDFWATWCVPCIKELPHFQKFYDRYKEKGLRIFSISVDGPETVALVKTFVKRYRYSFPVLLDTESRVVALYNPRVILPYSILIDREGNINYVHQGYSPGDENFLEQKIIKLLKPKEIGKLKKFSYHINEAFLSRNFSDKDYVDQVREGRTSQIINQLDLSLTGGDYLLGLRFDSYLDFSPLKEKFALAKRFFELNNEKLSLRVGDFYYSSGRGLALSVLKTFEKEGLEYIIDTTIDGGKISFGYGQIFAEILGGWIDRETSSQKDKIFTGVFSWKVKHIANFQFNYLYSRLEEGSSFDNRKVSMESISLDIPKISEHAKFYGEFSLIHKDTYYSDDRINGHGLYLEPGFYIGNFSFLLEFKDYKYLDFEYNRPPLLESELLEILANQFDTDATNVTGISSRVDYYYPKISTLFYGKFSFIKDSPENHPLFGKYKREITHFFGGVEKKFKSTGYLNLLAGYRKEDDSSSIFLSTHGNTFHYQFNVSYPLTSRISVEADWKSKDFKGEYIDYHERRSFLSFHYSPRWIITLFFDQTNDPEVLFIKNKKNWWAGQIEVKIFHSNSIRIFFGSAKGAVKCSGGICKFFPPFEGLRIEAILRF